MALEARLRALADPLPPGGSVLLTREALYALLEEEAGDPAALEASPALVQDAEPETWRERLWRVPAETRLGVPELAEALGRSRSFVYERTRSGAPDPIPHRKLGVELVFTAGEVRAWIRAQERVVVAGPMESPPAERKVGGARGR